jgi:hypothetical protein
MTEHVLHPAAERLRHAGGRRVGTPQLCEHAGAEFSLWKDAFELVDGGVDRVVQADGRDRRGIGAGTRRQRHAPRRHLGVEHRTRSNLFPVVIFRVDPEDRHRRDDVIA